MMMMSAMVPDVYDCALGGTAVIFVLFNRQHLDAEKFLKGLSMGRGGDNKNVRMEWKVP